MDNQKDILSVFSKIKSRSASSSGSGFDSQNLVLDVFLNDDLVPVVLTHMLAQYGLSDEQMTKSYGLISN